MSQSFSQGRRIAGHNGYGGQSGFADAEAGIGVGYVTNFNSQYADMFDPRVLDLAQAFYNGLSNFKSMQKNWTVKAYLLMSILVGYNGRNGGVKGLIHGYPFNVSKVSQGIL